MVTEIIVYIQNQYLINPIFCNQSRHHKIILHLPSGLSQIIIKKKNIQQNTYTVYSRISILFYQLYSLNETALFSEINKKIRDRNENVELVLIEEEDNLIDIFNISKIPDYKIGDWVRHIKDRINRDSKIVNVILNSSEIHILFNIDISRREII